MVLCWPLRITAAILTELAIRGVTPPTPLSDGKSVILISAGVSDLSGFLGMATFVRLVIHLCGVNLAKQDWAA
jgi:hypothetical protein